MNQAVDMLLYGVAIASPNVVAVQPLVERIVEWDEYVGRLEACESVEIRSQIGGCFASPHFDEED